METTLNDLPKNQADSLRDTTATRKLFEMGQKWSGNGQSWVDAAKARAKLNGIPVHFIVDKIRQENSSFNPTLKASDPNSSGTGLGQFVKGTANHLGIDPTDPIQSINGIADYMGELKKQGNNTYEDISKAYTLGPTGYKKYQQGQHVQGEQYLPSIDKFLVANNLKNNSKPQGDEISIEEIQPQVSQSYMMTEGQPSSGQMMQQSTGGLQLQDPREMQQFLAHPKRELEEQQNMQHLAQLKMQRDQLMETPYHNIQDLEDLKII